MQIHPVAAFILLFAALILLGYIEALHYACVTVEKWDMSKVAVEFPRAAKCQQLVDNPEKVKKFLVGRQFFVIFVVFLIAQLTTFPYMPKDFAGLSPGMVTALAKTGLPGVALVLTFGQLISQLFVEEFTVQFLNLPGNVFVIHLCLFTEYIGVCHFSWLLFKLSEQFSCQKIMAVQEKIDSDLEEEKLERAAVTDPNMKEGALVTVDDDETKKCGGPVLELGKERIDWFDAFRYLWSTGLAIFAIIVVCYGISKEVYILPVPAAGGFIIAVVALFILFYLEGLMIAIAATQYWDPEQWRECYPRAYDVHKLVNQPEGVKKFIIGRQFFTVLTGFLLAEVFTFAFWTNDGYDPVGFYILVQSGLVGVLIVLSFGQLNPELLAAEYPLEFMNMRFSYTVCYMSFIFDALGVGHCGWATYYALQAVGIKPGDAVAGTESAQLKPEVMRVRSAELMYMTGSVYGERPPPGDLSLSHPDSIAKAA